MSVLVQEGTVKYFGYGGGAVPVGFIVYDGPIIPDTEDPLDILMLPDPAGLRPMTGPEILDFRKQNKINLLARESVHRRTVRNVAAEVVILALPNEAAVKAYDVAADPVWP